MGDAFGLSSSLKYFEYEFDSNDAVSSYSSSATSLDWPVFQMERPLSDIAGIKVLEVQIPFSFYIVTQENNSFYWVTYGIYVYVPYGNYSPSSFAVALQTAFAVANPSAPVVTVTFQSVTQTYKFTPASGNIQLKFGDNSKDDGSRNLRILMGFNGGETLTQSSLTSPNTINTYGPNYLYINSESLGTLVQLYLPASTELSQGGLGPQLAKIPVNCNPNYVIFWQDPDANKYFDIESLFTLQQVDLYLTLGNTIAQKPLRLNGQGFSVKLGIVVNAESRTDTTVNTSKRIRSI